MEKIIVALVSPYDQEGNFNEGMMRRLMDRQLAQGADGFFIGGSSGECFYLRPEERIRAFELAAEYRGRAQIMAHVGALSTAEALDYVRRASALGLEPASTPPFYFRLSGRELRAYYDELASAAGRPILYYNIPSSTHVELDTGNAEHAAMLRSGCIHAIKHTNLNLLQMERIRALNPEIAMYGGFESCMLAFLGFGCEGFIGSSFNIILPEFRRILEAYHAGQMNAAQDLQTRCNDVIDGLLSLGLCASLKHILRTEGMDAGEVRRPMLPLTESARARLDELMERLRED